MSRAGSRILVFEDRRQSRGPSAASGATYCDDRHWSEPDMQEMPIFSGYVDDFSKGKIGRTVISAKVSDP